MTTTAENLADPELLQTEWDLSPLVDDDPEGGVDRQLEQARDRATAFAERHAGHVAELDIGGLREAMQELEAINELIGKAASYASLRFATNTADPARGALLQRMQEWATESETEVLVFGRGGAGRDDEHAAEAVQVEGVDVG